MKHTDKNKRPTSSHVDHSTIPDVLRLERHWVLWKFEWREDKQDTGTWSKVPYHPAGYRAASTNPDNWSTFETVIATLEQSKGKYDGIGFVFSDDLPFVGIDLDNCVTRAEDEFHLTPFAARVVERLSTYSEFSPSMTGVHCIGIADQMSATKVSWNGNEIEVYRSGRYFTFTGISWHEKVLDVQDVNLDLKAILDIVKKPVSEANGQSLATLDIQKRIDMALKNPKIEQLYFGNTLPYGGDDSRADMALCALMAYYSEGSSEILDKMFRASKLMRSKWDERHGPDTYGNLTIAKVLANHKHFVSVRQTKNLVAATPDSRRTRRFTFSDLWDAAMDYRRNPGARGVTTGWPTLDQFYMPAKGLLSVVTGIPSAGKSTFVDALTYNIAVQHQWRITFASFETQPMQRHILNLCQIHLAKPTYAFIPGCASDDEMEVAREEISEYFNFIMPDANELDMLSILEYIDDEIKDYGIEGFVLDPFTELDHARPHGMNQTEHIEIVLRQLQQFTRYRDIHSWLIAHPTKSGETYKDGRPTLYSINGCHDAETEVLTFDGWIKHCELKPEQLVACFDVDTELISYQMPSELHKYEYRGEMCWFKGKAMDIMVTPEHRMLIKPDWELKPDNGTQIGRASKFRNGCWNFLLAGEINKGSAYLLPKSAEFLHQDAVPERIDFDGGYEAEAFFSLIGWFVSEGCIVMKSIQLCQADENSQPIRELVKRLNLVCGEKVTQWRPTEKPLYQMRVHKSEHPDLARFFVEHCGGKSATKKLPGIVWKASRIQKQRVFDAMIAGDGSVSRKGYKYYTCSAQLADDMMRLAIELGCKATRRFYKSDNEKWQDKYVVYIMPNKKTEWLMPVNKQKQFYDGFVYCLTVPTGAYLTRRNGSMAITGNSAHFRNKADFGIVVHRTDANETQVIVEKVRNDVNGTAGEVAFRFDRATKQYIELDSVAREVIGFDG
jgi:replicative DNA helicase